MDQLMAMRAFTRVVETGSFTRAADSLNMPIATLSKLVKALEAHLEIRLLHRTTRRVVTTPEGAEYYEKAVRVLIDIEDIDTSFRVSHATPKGHLRVDIGGSTARDVLIPLLPDFMQRYPDIRIDLGVADRPVDLISGNVDCVIRGGPLNDSTLIARHLGDADMVTCATPGYLKKHGVPAYPQELRNGHKLISYLSPRSPGGPFRFASGKAARCRRSAFRTISALMKAMRTWQRRWQDWASFRRLRIQQRHIFRRVRYKKF